MISDLLSQKVYQDMVLLIVLALCHTGRGQETSRHEKFLSVFKVVQFPNEGCNTSLSRYGVCYTATECRSLGGSASGSCASGFGVCCSFSSGCGERSSQNNTYFTSTGASSPCTLTVCKASAEVCQLRLNFSKFVLASPSTAYPGDGEPNSRGSCIQARFTAETDGPRPPVICGTNSGHHMILEAKDECNKLTFTWDNAVDNSWDIHVMQIPCSAPWKPAAGCLQYFTGTTGILYSFNYADSLHLTNQQYEVCVRTEEGYCSISYSSLSSTSFQISGIAPSTSAAIALVGDSCSQDWVSIPGGGQTSGASTSSDRHCGSYLSYTNSGTSPTTVITNKMPFKVGVNFDGTELDSSSANEWSKGFAIYYSQTSC